MEWAPLVAKVARAHCSAFATRDGFDRQAFTFHWDDILAERLGDGFARVQQADFARVHPSWRGFRVPDFLAMNCNGEPQQGWWT